MEESLNVLGVNLYARENATPHHTDLYEVVNQDFPWAVLRRGQTFFMGLRYNRPLTSDDNVGVVCSFGPQPHPMRDTRGVVRLPGSEEFSSDAYKWEGKTNTHHGDTVVLEVRSPVDCPVGAWSISVETPDSLYQHPDLLYILFNPWCKTDAVFMEQSDLLDEYVLNDVGKVWVGPTGSSRGREWVFGQFDSLALPSAMFVLDRTALLHQDRGDPVRIVRALSKLVNSNDDGGVLVGRWDGQYSDGVPPAAWTGSVPILEQYLNTGREVRYGQCWVFASVLTTLCRVLGIPSRVVSNLVSAHDANASLSVDRYYTEENGELPWDPMNATGARDSVWNYHVWNDVWMARPDLPKGYGGWQACDATPQETSDSFFQCGPASHEAIRRGEVGLKYDVSFMLASVNADLIRWKEDPKSDIGFTRIDSNKYHIGRMILTKQPWIFDPNGDEDRQDITEDYKAPEGTHAERLALLNAVRGSARAKRFFDLPPPSNEDVDFQLQDLEKIDIGQPFAIVVKIQNFAPEPRRVRAVLSAASVFYTGIKANVIKKASGTFVVEPEATELLRLVIHPDDYTERLVEYCNMKTYAMATVEDTHQTWAAEDDFQVIVPSLQITIQEQPTVGQPCSASFSFSNPLNRTLTDCELRCEGPGLTRSLVLPYRDVQPGEDFYVEQALVPQRYGPLKLVANFTSKQLVDITGSAAIDVV